MQTQYRFTLQVECPDGKRHTHSIDVDAFAAPQFDRYDLCSELMSAMMAGGVMSMGAARIDTDRKHLADQISVFLTDCILESIKARDLRNGYKQ